MSEQQAPRSPQIDVMGSYGHHPPPSGKGGGVKIVPTWTGRAHGKLFTLR